MVTVLNGHLAWPDWTGRRMVVMASGPSLTVEQARLVRDARERDPRLLVCVINETWKRLPTADVLFGCDWQWHRWKAPRKHDFTGMRIVGTLPKNGHLPPDMHWQAPLLRHVPVRPGAYYMIWDDPELGSGGNSAFQLVNLGVRRGVEDVILLGVDCHSNGLRWHGNHDHPEQPGDKDSSAMLKWRRAWNTAARDLKARGVRVLNCSPGTRVWSFTRIPLSEALALEGVE